MIHPIRKFGSAGEDRPEVSSGFNTDVRVGERVLHVQTEAYGSTQSIIVTQVFLRGRILHRRSTSYRELLDQPGFGEKILRQRVEQQHREIIEGLRSGAIDVGEKSQSLASPSSPGIAVQLLNASSWLAGANATLVLEVVGKEDGRPRAGAIVEARVEGALTEDRYAGTSDDFGCVCIRFRLPPLGKGDLALVIRAQSDSAEDQIQIPMGSPAEAPPPGLMTVTVNGEIRRVPDGLTVAALVQHLGLPAARVAIERNLNVLPRAQWNETPVQPDDRYEIVHLVGGG